MNLKKIYLRKEYYDNEYRTPLTPNDINILIKNNFIVYVQSSNNRCFTDNEYCEKGAIIVNNEWYDYNECLIIGIKELNFINNLNKNNFTHLYFSHTYKNQINSKYILEKFKYSNSILYDLEYFIYPDNKRIITFSNYAGFVGTSLGIWQFYNKYNNIKNISHLTYWNSFDDMYKFISTKIINNIKIAIIGSNGNCGSGVKHVLDLLSLKYTEFNKNSDKSSLTNYDIVYNCINLTEFIEPWFHKNTIFTKNIVIVDISCDYTNIYNPIKIYDKSTNWINPVYSYSEFVDIIAIENLPSLLPIDSSIYFSRKIIELLINPEYKKYWDNNLNLYYEKINNIF
jgi:saccharopine dehydrogenase (NAD+, L-lysine-forming)